MTVPVDLPTWIRSLRTVEIVNRIYADPRSTGNSILGMQFNDVADAIGGGQADFDSHRRALSPDDLALLYAYQNQLGHVEVLALSE